MDAIGPHGRFFFLPLFHTLIPLLWLGLSLASLFQLRKRNLNDVASALWALLICAIPILGAVAFWIVNPTRADDGGVG